MIELNPQPGYVVKTLVSSGQRQGKKLFINVCSDTRIPEPNCGYGDVLVERLQAGEDCTVPIIVSHERNVFDKAGKESFVRDCCMHPQVIVEGIKNNAFRVFTIETCLELVEDCSKETLSREYTLPKLVQKGEFEKTVISENDLQQESLGMAQSMDDFAKSVLQDDAPLTDLDAASTQAKIKKPLIQVLSEEDKEEEQEVTYKIAPFGAAPEPQYCVMINNADNTTRVRLDETGRKVTVNKTVVGLPIATTKIEPYYVTKTQTMHIFIY